MTQTPASGPNRLVTIPPISSEPIFRDGAATMPPGGAGGCCANATIGDEAAMIENAMPRVSVDVLLLATLASPPLAPCSVIEGYCSPCPDVYRPIPVAGGVATARAVPRREPEGIPCLQGIFPSGAGRNRFSVCRTETWRVVGPVSRHANREITGAEQRSPSA